MSVPEKLVEVAAASVCRHVGEGYTCDPCKTQARAFVAAAAAALPKVLGSEPSHSGSQEYRDGWADCLAALAREFGEPTP